MGTYTKPRSCPRCNYQTKDSGNLRRHIQNCTKPPADISSALLDVKYSQENDTTLVTPLKFDDEKPFFEGGADLTNTDPVLLPQKPQADQSTTNRQPVNKRKPSSNSLHSSERSFTRNNHFSESPAPEPGIQFPRAAEYRPRYVPMGNHSNASDSLTKPARPTDYYGYSPSAAYDSSQASNSAVMMQVLHSLLKIEHRLDRIEAQIGLM